MITLSKWSLFELDPASLGALVMSVGAASVALWLTIARRWKCAVTLRGAGWKWTLGLSALFFVVMLASFEAIRLLDPTVVAFVSRTETLVAIVLGVWLFGERFTKPEMVGAAFVVLGIVVLRYGGVSVERGFWIILAASIGFGIAEAIAKKTVTIVDPLAFSLVRNMILGVAFAAFGLIWSGGIATPTSTLGWLAIVAIGISGPFLGRVHFLKALQKITISKTSLVTQSQPIWVALLAFAVLRTVPSERQWLGGAIVLAGCVLLIIGRSRPRAAGFRS